MTSLRMFLFMEVQDSPHIKPEDKERIGADLLRGAAVIMGAKG